MYILFINLKRNKKHLTIVGHDIYFFRILNGYFKFLDENLIGTVVSLYFSFYSHKCHMENVNI